ncbi:arrestin n-terminal domain containing protein [Niveomyces insectorum RCEF 264]|uniref:Arrestin n-terminal domain containing protein n=1 Tax=Niveomyces insectorum RCEF 264 TaxID=1081102 RepID=A0A167PI39_9HYPO|nr:arrestin n-terminal domain containing protein [Niveomyces insectorum RCEF 264]
MSGPELLFGLHGSTLAGTSDSGSSILSAGSVPPLRRGAYPKTLMEIRLDNHHQARVYTSGETITGTVTIVPQRDVSFDLFEITLLGTTHTRVDNISSPVLSSHVFLKLLMPIDSSAYPVPRILEAQQTYTLPLHFVVPQQLTLSACSHSVDDPLVHAHHLRLPPTMGVFGNSNGGSGSANGATARWERDDMAPEMARVEYAIKARIYRDDGVKDAAAVAVGADEKRDTRVKIVEAVHPLRILPTTIDTGLPAPALTDKDRLYKPTTAKTLRKGFALPLFRSSSSGSSGNKLGRVSAAVVASGSDANANANGSPVVVLRPGDGTAAAPATAAVQLTFDPAAPDVPPPRVTSVSAKVTAHTFFSAGPSQAFPDRGDGSRHDTMARTRRGSYSTTVPLFTRNVHDFRWEAQVDTGRRDSGYCSSDEGSGGGGGSSSSPEHRRRPASSSPPSSPQKPAVGLFYAAQLVVPLALPSSKKMFLPTFHSCIASRTYALQLAVTVVPGSTTSSSGRDRRGSGKSGSSKSGSESSGWAAAATATTLTLTVPLEVVVGADPDAGGAPAELRGGLGGGRRRRTLAAAGVGLAGRAVPRKRESASGLPRDRMGAAVAGWLAVSFFFSVPYFCSHFSTKSVLKRHE